MVLGLIQVIMVTFAHIVFDLWSQEAQVHTDPDPFLCANSDYAFKPCVNISVPEYSRLLM